MNGQQLSMIFKEIEPTKRQLLHKIFIIVEGEKTEYDYVKKLLKYRYFKIETHIIFQIENAFCNIVEVLKAKDWDDSIDKCFILSDFDRAYHKDTRGARQEFRKGYSELLKYDAIAVLYSNPSFEYWIYLHVENQFIVEAKRCTAETIVEKVNEKVSLKLKRKEKDFGKLYHKIGEETFFTIKVLEASEKSIAQMQHHSINRRQKIDKFPREHLFTMVGQLISELDEIRENESYNSANYKIGIRKK